MRVVMDDAGDLPSEVVEKSNIAVIPVNITFGTEEFVSGITMSHQEFYEKVQEVGDHNFPKTAQPTPYQFTEFYRSILDSGEDEILTVTVGEKLSGTYASAEISIRDLEGQGTFHLFDSMGGSAAQGYMALAAARMAAEGVEAKAILDRLETMREQMVVVFLIDSLDYAVRGGRVSSLQSTVASLLRIKPIMKLEDGLIVEAGKVRTYKKALDYIVDYVHERVGNKQIKLAFIHANDPEGVIELQRKATPKLNATETITTEMGLPVSINLGPGALGNRSHTCVECIMIEDDFSEFMTDYSEAMRARNEQSGRSLTGQPDDSAELRTLFTLSNSVRSVLVPVRAPSFKGSLRQRLGSRQRDKTRFRNLGSRQKAVWIVVATAGSVLSITGVILLVLRKLKTTGKIERQAVTAAL